MAEENKTGVQPAAGVTQVQVVDGNAASQVAQPGAGAVTQQQATATSTVAPQSAETGPGAGIITVPGKDADAATWNKFYDALGRPTDAKGYEVTLPEGRALDEGFHGAMTKIAHEAGLTKSQYAKFAAAVDAYAIEQTRAAEVAMEQANQSAKGRLQATWGNAFQDKFAYTQQVLAGTFSPEVIGLIDDSGLGANADFILGVAKLAEAAGQDRLGPVVPRKGAMTPADAQRELDRMALDPETQKALMSAAHPAHEEVIARRARLYEALHGEQNTISRMVGQGKIQPRVVVVGAGAP